MEKVLAEIGTIKAKRRPYVIITSNQTRELHDALKRRCLYHWIDYPSFEKALDNISRTVLDWSGGSKIGECIRTFNRRYSYPFSYQKTIVIIISDGWDRGDENLLRKQMEQLRKKTYHIIWLNSLLGSPQCQPICKGMRTVLPFLDQFLPLHNLNSLINLGQVLCRIN